MVFVNNQPTLGRKTRQIVGQIPNVRSECVAIRAEFANSRRQKMKGRVEIEPM